MPKLVTVLKELLRNVAAFSQHASGVTLRAYQAPIAEAIVESVVNRLGLTFVVMLPRQSGKNELQAQLQTYLLTLFSQLHGEMVMISPTWKPQSLNAMRRLERTLQRNLITRDRWRRRDGYVFNVDTANCYFLSGGPDANIVGATANVLLDIDEAQDILPSKFDKDISPMGASTNVTTVFCGTAWTSNTLLAREMRASLAAQEKDGRQRVFKFTADQVAAEVKAYGAYVEKQVQKLGRNHPLVARIPVTIASSASLSSAVKLRGELLTIIEMPAAWDAANLTFQTSGDGSTFMNLYDENGSEVTVTAAVSRRIRLEPSQWAGIAEIKVRSGTSSSAVTQSATQTLYLEVWE